MTARVLHMELDRGPQPVVSDGPHPWLYLVFWRNALPLGHVVLHRTQLPLTAAQVGELASRVIAPAVGYRLFGDGFEPSLPIAESLNAGRRRAPDLARIARRQRPVAALEPGDAPGEVGATVSVVVCTRDRPEQLERCLRSLRRCRPLPDEVVVVDNAPRDDRTRRLLAAFPGVQYVAERRPGLSRARNTGIGTTTGEIVAFTDDDVEVHERWVARIRAAMRDDAVASVTGLVLPASLDDEAEWRFEREFGGFGQGYRALVFDLFFLDASMRWGAPVWKIGAGANMAIRRSALTAVGGFDERLGAGAAGCSEDSEMWYRLLVAGFRCVYEPSAVVLHHHRASMDALRGQMRAYTKGHVAALLVQWQRHRHVGNLRRLCISIPWYYVRRLLSDASHLFRGRDPTYWAQVAGVPAGVWYYLMHRGTPGAPRITSASE